MDRPSQTHLYAGLLVYRSFRNTEFLLLNDSFTNKKHWFCPKGLVLGQEDELKCALRETFEATGLGPHLLRIEEGFKIQLRYLSGTKPKKVVYYLAQLVDNHARLLANAEGVHLQWCNQQVASEKVVFKSMQDVFHHAQSFIETKKINNNNNNNNNRYHSHNQQHQQYNNGKRNTSSGQHLKGNKMTVSSSRSRPQLGETSPIATAATMGNENQHSNHNGNNGMALRQNQPRMMDRPSSAPAFRSSPSPPQPSSSFSHSATDGADHNNNSNNNNNNNNPLFKTRLCERFETDGECPYGPRCTFAHGIQELRGRLNKEGHGTGGNHLPNTTNTHANAAATTTITTTVSSTVLPSDEDDRKENGTHFTKDVTENPLYKTKLCDRFMKDQFCQYGPKCHFAHGRSELKERPNHHQHHHQQQHHHHHHQNQNQNQNQSPEELATPHSSDTAIPNNATTTALSLQHDADAKKSFTKDDEKTKETELSRDPSSQCRTSPPPAVSLKLDATEDTASAPVPPPSELRSPLPVLSELNLNGNKHNHSIRRSVPVQQKQLHTPPEHQTQHHHHVRQQQQQQQQHHQPPQQGTQHHTLVNPTPTKKRPSNSDPDLVLNGDIMQTDKSWMKVVHLSKEEQVKLAMPPVTKTPSPTPSKVAQEEAIISELSLFFQSPESSTMAQQQTTQQHLLTKDVKQVTKVEMRNDLTKSQLFYILLASLLQNSADCPVGTILRSREHLFKTFVKSTTDQRILLKAWDRCVQRYPLLLPKSTLVLSQWYECDLLDEEACYVWFDGLDANGELKKKIIKFIDWLKTADEEDDD